MKSRRSYLPLRPMVKAGLALVLVFWGSSGVGAPLRAREVMLPMTCSELLPEPEPYRQFFEVVARGAVGTKTSFSKRLFRVLALREKINEGAKHADGENPIDTLIRKTLCFYRESRDPLRAVSFEDPEFLKYLESSLDELEKKSEQAVFESELARHQREEYERRLNRNQGLVERLQEEAERAADKSFSDLSRKAKRQAGNP